MKVLPFFITSLLGWVVAHFFSCCDREQSAMSNGMRMGHYPIGIAGASLGTWISQNTPALYNKVFIVGIVFSGIALVIYQTARYFLRHVGQSKSWR